MPQNSQNWPKLVPQKSLKTGKNGPRGPKGQKIWYLSFPKLFSDPFKNHLFLALKNLNFPPFFSKKNILKPIFNNEPMKFGKNLIYYSNILHEKWHISKENQIYHETKMSKITHSVLVRLIGHSSMHNSSWSEMW